MNTTSTFDNGQLTISISGRADSTEARKMQDDINSILSKHEGIERIVIDAEELSFISSMGLRVFLFLSKKYKDLSVINCSAEVFNVFKMTGFNHIINVEKALRRISIDGLEEIKGMQDCFQLTEDTMVKVFPEGTPKTEVDREVALARELFVRGIPTAMAFNEVRVGRCWGLIYESITPSEVDAKTFGDMVRSMHNVIIEPDGKIPSAIDMEKTAVERLRPYLGDDAVKKLLQILSVIPDGSSLLHGNITIGKVMRHGGEPIILDMSGVGYGNAIIDLAHFYSSLREANRLDFFDEFLHSYYNMESDETIARNFQNIRILSIIHHFTHLINNAEPDDTTVETYRKEFQEKIAMRWDEILSHLHFKIDFNEEIRKLERQRFYLDCDVDIDWLANTLGTNRHYVSDYFNKVLHTSFNDYINTLRLDYAVQLIRSGKVSPSQIAYSAGFNNDHTFRRLFKQRFGCTPSQFEK